KSSADLCARHSFPTRRSSDLSNAKYVNPSTGLETYFLTFNSGARLELMQRADIPENKNDTIAQYRGIIHLAFAVASPAEVDKIRSEEHTSELQSRENLVCRLL